MVADLSCSSSRSMPPRLMPRKEPSPSLTSASSASTSWYALPTTNSPTRLTPSFPRQLGKGRVAKPFIVKARFVSRLAEQKIREAGGVVKLVA